MTTSPRNPLRLVQSGVHVARQSGKLFSRPLQARLAKRGWRHRLHDLLIIGLATTLMSLGVVRMIHTDPGRHVTFRAVVAPEQPISGADSTLSIAYTNTSKKTLEDVRLTLAYPPYFHLQSVEQETFEPQTNTITLGTLAPGANGLVKVRGVLFGDVGGEQTFTSTLAYSWDHGKEQGTREQRYTFSPASSALSITTQLPDQLVGGQHISGELTLTNNGSVTFPEAAIQARFPDGFTIRTTSLAQRVDGTWIVPSLEPSETLTITYAGNLHLQTGEEATFTFAPSFVFGDERFTQDILTETVATVPPPVQLTLDVPEHLTVGEPVDVQLHWSDQTDLTIENAVLSVDGAVQQSQRPLDTPILAGDTTLALTPRGHGAEQTITWTPALTFALPGNEEPVTVLGESQTRRLTSPLTLQGFARYFTPSGDQLGRGPLPLQAGDATTYWLFLNVQGTTSDLSGVRVEATLPDNVQWADKQSVTVGHPIQYDAATRRLSWVIDTLPALITSGRTAAASFAVTITPTAGQIGTTPPLLLQPRVSGTDTWTQQPVSRTIGALTTRITEDNGRVR